ncbi:transposable element Tcb2 transposase [Trichonephila clavipes]|nr:transposable element Tcb2 transposase [Trichonephila clavipes]
MGDVVVLLGRKFRQTLPVIGRDTAANEINACLKASYIWTKVEKLFPTTNMPVQLFSYIESGAYAQKLLEIGESHLQTPTKKGPNSSRISQAIGVSQSTISMIWNRFLGTGSAGRRPGQDRRRVPMPNEDRYLVLTAWRHRNMNANLHHQHLRSATGTTVSTETVRNWLHGVAMYAHRPKVCVRLISRHRLDCKEWATEHVNWRRNEWSNVLFSDESRFSVHPDNRRIFIWRDRGSRNNPAFVHESVRFCGGGVLVFGGISIDGRTYLYIIRDGSLTARPYRGMRSLDLL